MANHIVDMAIWQVAAEALPKPRRAAAMRQAGPGGGGNDMAALCRYWSSRHRAGDAAAIAA